MFYLSNQSTSRGRQPCGLLLQELPSSSRKLLSRSVPARRGRSGALIGGKEPSSAKPRRPSATDCEGSIPRSHKARADMLSRRRSSNRRQNRLRPPTRRDRRQPNDSQRRLEHRCTGNGDPAPRPPARRARLRDRSVQLCTAKYSLSRPQSCFLSFAAPTFLPCRRHGARSPHRSPGIGRFRPGFRQ